jgi:hypothetical protein
VDLAQHVKNTWDQRFIIHKTVSASDKDNDGDVVAGDVLLILESLVSREEGLKETAGSAEKLSIAEALPAHFGYRTDLVIWKDGFETVR